MWRRAIVLALGLLLLAVPVASADDIYPPWWRDDPWPWTTFQEWTFPGRFAGTPDRVTNRFGAATMRPAAGANGTRDWRPAYQGRTGVWQLTGAASLQFTVPNANQERKQKEVWVQVTYHAFFGEPRVEVGPGAWRSAFTGNPRVTDLGGGWSLLSVGFHSMSCPASEIVTVRPPSDGSRKAYIDQVVIDTVCW